MAAGSRATPPKTPIHALAIRCGRTWPSISELTTFVATGTRGSAAPGRRTEVSTSSPSVDTRLPAGAPSVRTLGAAGTAASR